MMGYTHYLIIYVLAKLLISFVSRLKEERGVSVKRPAVNFKTKKRKEGLMLFHWLRRKVYAVSNVFNGNYMDTKVLYALRFNELPSVLIVGQIEVNKGFEFIRETMNKEIVDFFQYAHYAHEEGTAYFTCSVFVLRGGRVIELGPGYVEILHGNRDFG